MSNRTTRTLWRAALSLIVAVSGTACATGDAPTTEASVPGQTASVSLALKGDTLGDAATMAVRFIDEATGDAVIDDAFALGGGADTTSRNYRLSPGTYTVDAVAKDEASETTLLGGATGVIVAPGDNAIDLLLRNPSEDLGDLKIGFDLDGPQIQFVSATGDALEGSTFGVTAQIAAGDPAALQGVTVQGHVVALGPGFEEQELLTFELSPVASKPGLFAGQAPADCLGPIDVHIDVASDGQLADTTTKTVVCHPSAETFEKAVALGKALVVLEDGTLAPVKALQTPSGFELSPQGIAALNEAIATINIAVLSGDMLIAADLSNVMQPLIFASAGYWWCVGKILLCEAYSAGCVLAAPAVVAGCGTVCAGTLGLGCISCVVAGGAGGIALCQSAYDCWVDAKKNGCVP